MKCKNCHQKTDVLDKSDYCEDCAEAFSPEAVYTPVKTRKAGEYVTKMVSK
jgi:predicted amidophosphoribosyltransferase